MSKILVLQTARLGDILMSWPALRALRRARPGSEIHLLVRPRFEAASRGLEAVDRVIAMPASEILEPLLKDEADDGLAIARMAAFLNERRAENYDEIINLSYSPLSSWITKSIAGPAAVVRGYTRHEDGFLNIADGVASYFYAQVGPGRPNRIHLTDLFAAQMEVDLAPEDWRQPEVDACDLGLPESFIVVHAGASETGKTVPAFIWGRVAKRFAELRPRTGIVLIGAASEAALANEVRANAGGLPLIDLTGRTQFEDLFSVIARAKVLVGGDSAPMHVASLTGTRCLNLSVGDVNFWETGPRAAGSAVVRAQGPADLSSETIAQALVTLHDGGIPQDAIIAASGIPAYLRQNNEPGGDFSWELLQALYLDAAFPVTDSGTFVMAVQKLREMNDVVVEQLEAVNVESGALGSLMDRADEVFTAIARISPEAGVLVRFALTEKSRIAPGPLDAIRSEMKRIHRQLAQVLRLYDFEAAEAKG